MLLIIASETISFINYYAICIFSDYAFANHNYCFWFQFHFFAAVALI